MCVCEVMPECSLVSLALRDSVHAWCGEASDSVLDTLGLTAAADTCRIGNNIINHKCATYIYIYIIIIFLL